MNPDRKRLNDLKARYERLYEKFWSDQVLTRDEQTQLESIQKLGKDKEGTHIHGTKMDIRQIGTGAQILRNLGVKKMRIHTESI